MSDPLQHPTTGYIDLTREKRLFELRREAEKKGHVGGAGIRPAGAPFPVASPRDRVLRLAAAETAGVDLADSPILLCRRRGRIGMPFSVWSSRWIGGDRELARDCRFIAAAGTAVSSVLLISDLGRPSRFLGMMRVFKPQSPMSMGAWTLAVFGTFSAGAAFAEMLGRRFDSLPVRLMGDSSEGLSALAGLPFSNYTGVLIGASVIPVWNENVGTLPIHFGMSGLNSAVSILELLGHDNPALNTLGMGAAAIETIEGISIEASRKPAMEPLKRGRSGMITRLGGILSGPIPLALRIASAFAGPRRSRQLRKIAAASSVAGSMLTRIAWVHAGHVSASNWRLPLEIKDPGAEEQSSPHGLNISDRDTEQLRAARL